MLILISILSDVVVATKVGWQYVMGSSCLLTREILYFKLKAYILDNNLHNTVCAWLGLLCDDPSFTLINVFLSPHLHLALHPN